MRKFIRTTLMIAVLTTLTFGQNAHKTAQDAYKEHIPVYKFSVSTTI
jgi:hypothetical protein